MSLLLDALNRASKEKASAGGAAVPSVDTPKPDNAAADPSKLAPAADWPDLGLTLTPAEPSPASTPTPPPSPAEPTLNWEPTAAPIKPAEPSPPPTPDLTLAAAPTPAPGSSESPRPLAAKKPATPAAAPAVAQSLLRAKAPAPKKKAPVRLIGLGLIAAVLAGGLGSVLLGWWGDPMTWMQSSSITGPAMQPVATVLPVDPAPVAPSPVAATVEVSSPVSETPPATIAVVPTPAPKPAPAPIRAATRKTSEPRRIAAKAPTSPAVASPAQPKSVAAPAGKSSASMLQSRSTGPSALELGYAALIQGRMSDASQAYKQALTQNPEERDALLGLAYIAQQQGRVEEARTFYKRVLRQEPGNATAKSGLLTLSPAEDSFELGSRSQEVAEQNPDSAAAQSALGHALARQGRLADALQAFNRAQQLEPAVALHAFNLAVALDRMRNYGPARTVYERALTLSSQSGGERASGVPHGVVQSRLEQLRAASTTTPGANQ